MMVMYDMLSREGCSQRTGLLASRDECGMNFLRPLSMLKSSMNRVIDLLCSHTPLDWKIVIS